MKGKTRPIIFKIESYEPDVEQYKPAKPHVCPIDLYVLVDVPEEFFVPGAKLQNKKIDCLTLDGFLKLRKFLIGAKKPDGN